MVLLLQWRLLPPPRQPRYYSRLREERQRVRRRRGPRARPCPRGRVPPDAPRIPHADRGHVLQRHDHRPPKTCHCFQSRTRPPKVPFLAHFLVILVRQVRRLIRPTNRIGFVHTIRERRRRCDGKANLCFHLVARDLCFRFQTRRPC